jgi:hypothetical protein
MVAKENEVNLVGQIVGEYSRDFRAPSLWYPAVLVVLDLRRDALITRVLLGAFPGNASRSRLLSAIVSPDAESGIQSSKRVWLPRLPLSCIATTDFGLG